MGLSFEDGHVASSSCLRGKAPHHCSVLPAHRAQRYWNHTGKASCNNLLATCCYNRQLPTHRFTPALTSPHLSLSRAHCFTPHLPSSASGYALALLYALPRRPHAPDPEPTGQTTGGPEGHSLPGTGSSPLLPLGARVAGEGSHL